ncbi:MAG: Flp pilus assembly pilin Flp [Paracoccaceae bacterium]
MGATLFIKGVAFCLRNSCQLYEVIMFKKFQNFMRKEDGAVTVDWVVLTAAVVALAGVAFASLQSASGGLGNNVGDYLTAVEIEAVEME